MNRALRFGRTLRHFTPAQLARRAWSLTTRNALVAIQRYIGIERLLDGRNAPAFSKALPQPLFAARLAGANVDASGAKARFLRLERRLTLPMQWHPNSGEKHSLLETMHLHYMEWLEALDSERAEDWIRDWIAHVRPYRPGYWRDSWNPYSTSIRCVVWMQLLARHAEVWNEPFKDLMRASLFAQICFLGRNLERDIGGNHLIKNLKALLWAARIFEGRQARDIGLVGEKLLQRELSRQILSDGMHFERSPAYHAQVFADLCECLHVLEPSALRDRLTAALASMAQVLVDLAHPDGCVSQFGDGGLHMGYSIQACMDAFEQLTKCRPRASKFIRLGAAGIFGVRAESSLVLADCGAISAEHLPAHGHGDALAFEWSLDGSRFLVDAGVREYAAGRHRDWSRSTRAHNTVTLDDQDQCEFHGSFRVGRRANVTLEHLSASADELTVIGSHDGFSHQAGRPRHRRRLTLRARRIQVLDTIEGGRGQIVCARLLLHPDVRVEGSGNTLMLRREGTLVRLDCTHPATVDDSSWCPDLGLQLATRQITICYGNAPVSGGFSMECIASDERQSGSSVHPAGVFKSISATSLSSLVGRGPS